MNNLQMIEKKNNTEKLNFKRRAFYFGLFLSTLLLSSQLMAQENTAQDTAKVQVNYNKPEGAFATDSGYVQTQALDIGSNRGLFILSPDKMMQMRILGSVRAAFNYTDQDLLNKSSTQPISRYQQIFQHFHPIIMQAWGKQGLVLRLPAEQKKGEMFLSELKLILQVCQTIFVCAMPTDSLNILSLVKHGRCFQM